VATLNLFAHHGDSPARRDALRAGLEALDADLLALQEVVVQDGYDQADELLDLSTPSTEPTTGRVWAVVCPFGRCTRSTCT
jgi:hypothetical protein